MHSLKYKILLLTLLPLSLVLLVIGLLAIHNKSISERSLLLERLNSYRSLIESGDLTFETSADKTKLKSLLGETIEFSEILSRDFTVIYSSENSAAPLITEDEKIEFDEALEGIETSKNTVVERTEEPVFVIISPLIVNDRVVAVLHQGLSNEDSNQRVRQYAVYILFLTAMGIVTCFILISFLLDKVILRNILKLKKAAIELQRGDLNTKNDVASKDEIGELAATFNAMTKRLKSLYIGLEKEKGRLAEAKSKDEAILASIGDGLVVADETGKLIYFNEIASNIFGLDVNQRAPKQWQEKLGALDPVTLKPFPADQMPLTLAISGKTVNNCLLLIKNKQIPEGKFVNVTATPIVLNGKNIGGVAILRDMTKEREVDKAKTEFVSLASHQLRTPLSSVNWYTEMLLSGDAGTLNESQKEYLHEIYVGNQRMVLLVDALLNVSRMELGKFFVEPVPTDIVALIQSVIAEQKQWIDSKSLKFSCSLPKNLPPIEADPKLFRMIVQNLLANAVKYTPEKGKVSLSLALDDKQENLLLEITDTGYGIPKDQQDKIFGKLFRADNVRVTDTEGTGLGLYIVKAIVEHFGGKIWFKSPNTSTSKGGGENPGTTFYAQLPLEGMKQRELPQS